MAEATTNLPPAFVARMRALLGTEADALFAAYKRAPLTGLRVNLLKLRPEQLQRIAPWPLEPVPWCAEGFTVAPDARPGKHPYHAAGLYYMQEPSAMAVVEALQVRPGLRVLDLSAAPGGKATQIAALLDGAGLLVANEVEGSRVKALGENLERWGARNVVLTSEMPERLADHFGATFDRVLLDAPCSGEGMFRKRSIARDEWSEQHVAGCAVRQARILNQAARLVAPGGLLVYSTCTFAPEENEQRIAALLAAQPGWTLVEIPKRHGLAAGRPEWAGTTPMPTLTRTARLWPHLVAGEGHFIALLRNDGDSAPPAANPWPERESGLRRLFVGRGGPASARTTGGFVTADPASVSIWQSFERATLAVELPAEGLVRHGEQLYLAPEGAPDLGGLRVVRLGLWLGTLKPGRFEPAHALALALPPDAARHTVALAGDAVLRYLRGEALRLDQPGPDGWTLVTVDGWPLGWGRRVAGVIKNFYPKGLRWLG